MMNVWGVTLGLLFVLAVTNDMALAGAKKSSKKEGPKNNTEAPAAAPHDAPVETQAAPGVSEDKGPKVAEYKVAYGMAGCGLGGLILGRHNNKGAQIGAFFLNQIGFQSSAISCSKSSGCDAGPDIRTASTEQKVFLEVNLASLSRDAARGGGAHLNAFAAILGCEGKAQQRFVQLSRERYNDIFATENADEVLHQYQEALNGDELLHDACIRATTT
jgi:hypothetical protein